jgi:WD40-like Beta Propeller Repeat
MCCNFEWLTELGPGQAGIAILGRQTEELLHESDLTLLYLHEGTLFAAPFDPDRLETGGSAVPVLDDAAGDPGGAGGQFDWSQNGSLVYLSAKTGGVTYPIVWMDSSGKTIPLLAKPNGYGAPRFSPDGKRLAFTSPRSAGAT